MPDLTRIMRDCVDAQGPPQYCPRRPFFRVLERLREAVHFRQRGVAADNVLVSRADLAQLLEDFDRLDAEVRRLDALSRS
jgi:hypothetical protein